MNVHVSQYRTGQSSSRGAASQARLVPRIDIQAAALVRYIDPALSNVHGYGCLNLHATLRLALSDRTAGYCRSLRRSLLHSKHLATGKIPDRGRIEHNSDQLIVGRKSGDADACHANACIDQVKS